MMCKTLVSASPLRGTMISDILQSITDSTHWVARIPTTTTEQTTGIFHAPTGLSGLDLDDYISTLYQTQRGVDGPIILRTADEYEQEYLNDVVRQQSGAAADASEMIQMVDIDYNHQDAFFDTMVARTYVGYGSSSLGLPGDASQPAPHFYMYGTPGSYLASIPMPGL